MSVRVRHFLITNLRNVNYPNDNLLLMLYKSDARLSYHLLNLIAIYSRYKTQRAVLYLSMYRVDTRFRKVVDDHGMSEYLNGRNNAEYRRDNQFLTYLFI